MNTLSRNERLLRYLIVFILFIVVLVIPIASNYKDVVLNDILPFLFFGLAYSLTIYIFGGIEKEKVNNLNQVVTIYLLANFTAFVAFFSINGILRNPFNFDFSFLLLVISGINFPFLVYVLYNFIFNNLIPKKAVVIGDSNEWKSLVDEICEKSLRSIDIVSYENQLDLSKPDFNNLYHDIDYFIVTNSSHFKKIISLNSAVKILSIHTLTEYYLKKIPTKMLENFTDYYELSFSSPVRSKIAILIDFIISSLLLILVSPILLISILAIKVIDGGPVFFMQVRHGLYGKKFSIYKLRTMDLCPDGIIRTTKSGVLLRKLRINELPQLLNILRGEMSLIGPRPDVTSTYEFCISKIPFYNYRTFVLPGITGNAQLNYKYIDSLDEDAFSERLSFDLHYLKNQTAFYYISIFLRTFESLFKAKGK